MSDRAELVAAALVALPVALFLVGLIPVQPVAVVGDSMEPTYSGDVTLTACLDVDPDDLEAGDVVAFERGADVVVHRVTQVDAMIWTRGDNSDLDDGGVHPEDVLCRVVYAVDLPPE